MSEHKSGFGDFLTGLLVGGAIGYAVAMLNAPRTGEETRQILSERSRELRDKAVDTVQTTVDKTGKVVTEGRERLAETAEETRARLKKQAEDLKERGEAAVNNVRAQASDALHRAGDEADPQSPSTTGM